MTIEQKLDIYYWMQLTRTFDERMLVHWKQGRGVGGTFSQRGHEAISVGAAYPLGPGDVVSPMHRDLGAFLLRGITPREAFANLLGRATGPTRGRDANLHGMSHLERGIIGFISHLPHSLPVTLGVAMSFRYRDEPRVAMAFTGDGATNAGLYHEVLNMAGLYHAPLVIIVENNQYAYSTPCQHASKVRSIAGHAAGYCLQTTTVDGNDVEAVHAVAVAAVQRARAGNGPSLIEAHTLRMLGHAVHDGAEYVPRELLPPQARGGCRHDETARRDRSTVPGRGGGRCRVCRGEPVARSCDGDSRRVRRRSRAACRLTNRRRPQSGSQRTLQRRNHQYAVESRVKVTLDAEENSTTANGPADCCDVPSLPLHLTESPKHPNSSKYRLFARGGENWSSARAPASGGSVVTKLS
jgi:TPP-dependent pyruvate/acetoin dehydrogenase alpha subunit